MVWHLHKLSPIHKIRIEPTKRNSSNTTKFNLVTEDITVDLMEGFWKVTKHINAVFRFSGFNRTCLVNSVFACVVERLGLKSNWFRTRILWLLTPRVLHIKPSPSPLIVYKEEKLDGNYSHHSCPPSWISGLLWQFLGIHKDTRRQWVNEENCQRLKNRPKYFFQKKTRNKICPKRFISFDLVSLTKMNYISA